MCPNRYAGATRPSHYQPSKNMKATASRCSACSTFTIFAADATYPRRCGECNRIVHVRSLPEFALQPHDAIAVAASNYDENKCATTINVVTNKAIGTATQTITR